MMASTQQKKQPTEDEIWALQDKNPKGQEWPERIITWNPREYYLHTIAESYKAKSGFEWIFHFLQDKSFSKHKKQRVLRILFRNKGRRVNLFTASPITFMVVSQPESDTHAAHVYTLTLARNNKLHCPCEWEETTAHSETCTHCISVRCFFHFLTIDREQSSLQIQGAN